MKVSTLVLTAMVLSAAGCSLPLFGDRYFATAAADHEVARDTSVPPPIVQVRDFPHSSVASVFAWDVDDAQMGLSTSIAQTGKLVGGLRAGDHELYIEATQARLLGGFKYATVASGQLLLPTNWRRDPQACFHYPACSPQTSVGVRIADSLLRVNRDSLVVTFYPAARKPWTTTLRHELVSAYLQKVDSVVASRR